jgi:hypothetical protein
MEMLTSFCLLYPLIKFLETEGSFSSAIVFVLVNMEDFLAGAG